MKSSKLWLLAVPLFPLIALGAFIGAGIAYLRTGVKPHPSVRRPQVTGKP